MGEYISKTWFVFADNFNEYKKYELKTSNLQSVQKYILGKITFNNQIHYIDIQGNIKNNTSLTYVTFSPYFYYPLIEECSDNVNIMIKNELYQLNLNGNVKHFHDG